MFPFVKLVGKHGITSKGDSSDLEIFAFLMVDDFRYEKLQSLVLESDG